jgi:hypothetical protein
MLNSLSLSSMSENEDQFEVNYLYTLMRPGLRLMFDSNLETLFPINESYYETIFKNLNKNTFFSGSSTIPMNNVT